jgi:hypothetical protein
MSKGTKAVVQVVEHDPEKLQTFRTRSCSKSKTLERYPIQSERIALQRGPRGNPPCCRPQRGAQRHSGMTPEALPSLLPNPLLCLRYASRRGSVPSGKGS